VGPALSPERLRPVIALDGGSEAADYLILAPAAFAPAARELQAYRISQGLASKVVDVQEIYDAFSQGRPDPEGLRAYLKSAYSTWIRPPTYVLLFGDGTSDPRRYQASSPETWIPPYLADVDPWAGETAADNRYVAVDGDDLLPDMLIGRLPVNSLEEAGSLVAKIIRYETQSPEGSWRREMLFVADNADSAGDFPALSTEAEQAVRLPLRVSRLYLTPEAENSTSVRMALRERWNAGLELLVYTGHASIHQWAVENLIHIQEVNSLQNGLRLPVLLEMTCFTAAFHTPGFDTLDEGLLRHPSGGAAAVWGPTGLGLSTEHALLAEGFLAHVSEAETVTTVGEATLAGKIALVENGPAGLNLLDTFVLLGDPAMRIALDRSPGRLYLPAIQTSTDGG
jgi:hypothetical protein